PPPPLPMPQPIDPAALADAQDRMSWLATVIIFLLLLSAAAAALFAARMLLANWVGDPRQRDVAAAAPNVEVERSGAPRDDAANALGWLMRWLRNRLARRGAVARPREAAVADAWSTYQRLLSWAQKRGLARRQSETTGQLSARLA